MNKEHISIKHLSYTYPDGKEALRNIDLSIRRGEKVALIGPNGAGKSTLLLHLNGILMGDDRIEIDGIPITAKTVRIIRKKVGMIFQNPNDQLFCPTVYDEVAFGPLHFGISHDEVQRRVDSALFEVAMQSKKKRTSHHMSMGEKRRVSIAAVLSCQPEIMAMDEPAATLDPKRKRWLMNFINSSTLTTIIATHDLSLAMKTCHRIILMNEGKIIADGTADDILSDKSLLECNDLAMDA